MPKAYTKLELKKGIEEKMQRHFGRSISEAKPEQVFRACVFLIRDIMSRKRFADNSKRGEGERQLHYMSLEFLLGRSLEKNAFNLGILPELRGAISDLGFDPDGVINVEPDAGLGNGGLGRLAACYLEALTTLNMPATGYSICYEYGIFKQKIIDGRQEELPDNWMEKGRSWLSQNIDEAKEVRFGGTLHKYWSEDGRMMVSHTDYTPVMAVPLDIAVVGYKTDHVNTLRLWSAQSPEPIDMDLFSRGEHIKALERRAMAEVITKVLYPADDNYEGKLLRLKQQYFFASATVQDIVGKHLSRHGTLSNFADLHVLHINDTHPTLAIAEFMRILLDEHGYEWDAAFDLVSRSFAYTNHTVMVEALERWPQRIISGLLPRIWEILCEINNRFCARVAEAFPGDPGKVAQMAVVWDGEVRMANLCAAVSYKINGVSALHTEILRSDVFKNFNALMPEKFVNVTNGIDHRRWLAQINPGLAELVKSLIGPGYLKNASDLTKLLKYTGDAAVLEGLARIKRENKERLSNLVFEASGIKADPDSVFDVQVKRLHEYKRQLLKVMHIISLYHRIIDNPDIEMRPVTFIFGAKAASSYRIAKQIIRLINSLAAEVNADPRVRGRIKIVFMENYRVTLAESLIPATEISEQISIAGKEASGTGNMKFMMNGALTIGTLDGANVEMAELVGRENIFIFGLLAEEAARLERSQSYNPLHLYDTNPRLRRVIDHLKSGFSDGVAYGDIADSLLFGQGGQRPDRYMLLADFEEYSRAFTRAMEAYDEPAGWNAASLVNIAKSGHFAADRSVSEYCGGIWGISPAGN